MKKNLLIFLLFLLYSHLGIAQWSEDPSIADTKVIVKNSGQHKSHIVTDGSGGAIIFWIDESGSGYDIYYNRLNSSGIAVWGTTSEGVRLTSNFSDYNDINQVISDGSGGAFIIWDNGGQIWLQHIDKTGAKVWPFNMLIGDGEDGFLCSDGEGGIIFAWSSYIGNNEYQTYAQRIDSDGNTNWHETGYDGIQVIVSAGSRKPMGIVSDGDGGAIIVVVDERNSTYDEEENLYDNSDIFAQRIDGNGFVKWGLGGMPVCLASGNQSRYGDRPSYIDYESYSQGQQHPSVVSDGAGGAIIAWEDYRDDPNNGNTELDNEGDIYAQRINQDGDYQWGLDGKVICDANGDQYAVSVMSNGNGGAVIAWVDRRDNSHYIYAQNMTISGNAQWGNNGILVSTEIDGLNYTTSPDQSNSAMLVSWATVNNFDYEIRAQKINVSDGTRGWPTNGVVLCSVGGSKSEPVITHAGIAGAIVAWTDERNSGTTNLDIYAGLVVDGALPISLTIFDAQVKNGTILLQWATSSEQNTAHFEIEQSKDGVVFLKIGSVRAAGNSTTTKDYAFTDLNAANGAHFYRLKIVDTDGRFTYSEIIKVTVSGRNSLQIFPNPAKDFLNIKVSGGNGSGLVQIFDLSGKKVKEQRINITGNSVVQIDITQLPKGVFNLKFTNQKHTEQVKFLKQ